MSALKTLFAAAKSMLSALTWKLVADTFSAVVGRITWTVVLERLLTRGLVATLRWLKELSTNDVVDETVELIIAMLEEKRLARVREQ